jgi:hypothetical protein
VLSSTSVSSPSAAASASASINKPSTGTIRLTPVKIAQRKKDGKCFYCNELFTDGHKLICKQLFSIEVVDDESTQPEATEATISIHVLTGIQPRSGRTMKLVVNIHGVRLLTLLDSGSTHNFVDTEAVVRAGIIFSASVGLRVAVANGDRLTSPGCCRQLPMSIHGECFIHDYYGLALGTYDMVLDVQWLIVGANSVGFRPPHPSLRARRPPSGLDRTGRRDTFTNTAGSIW